MNPSDYNSAQLHAAAVAVGCCLAEGLTAADLKTVIYFLSLVSEYLTSLLPKCK